MGVHPAQEPVKINYEDQEGNKYSEVHADSEKNLEVKTVAEQEGEVQPNVEGTTPDPINPELTDYERERREEADQKLDAAGGTKQADTAQNKQASSSESK